MCHATPHRPSAGLAPPVTALLVACLAGGVVAGESRRVGPFEVTTLADGVRLLRPDDAETTLTNSLLVEREDGLLVIDAQPSPDDAKRLLTAIGELSSAPVRYLVLSHAHAEAAGGAAAFPASTLVIAAHGARADLKNPRFDFGAEVRGRAAAPRSWQAPSIRLPALVVHARTELDDPRNPVELLPLAHAHTQGDLIVALPKHDILHAGSVFFVDSNPYGADADVEGWVGALNHLARLSPALVVPLRGKPGDARLLRQRRDALAWLRGQVEVALVDGVPEEEIPDLVFAAEDAPKHFNTVARPSFLRPLIRRAVEESLNHRRKRGVE